MWDAACPSRHGPDASRTRARNKFSKRGSTFSALKRRAGFSALKRRAGFSLTVDFDEQSGDVVFAAALVG